MLQKEVIGSGNWSISGVVHGSSTITLGIINSAEDAYAAACANRDGVNVFDVDPATAPANIQNAAALAFTVPLKCSRTY